MGVAVEFPLETSVVLDVSWNNVIMTNLTVSVTTSLAYGAPHEVERSFVFLSFVREPRSWPCETTNVFLFSRSAKPRPNSRSRKTRPTFRRVRRRWLRPPKCI